jgi:DNA gyrase subunit A
MGSYLIFVTRNGTVKRMEQAALKNIRASGIRALTLEEGDELISVLQTAGDEQIFIATHGGMAVCFNETDVRATGRTAIGVRGIRLRGGDWVVGAGATGEGRDVLSITEKGYGKRTDIGEYSVHSRGGVGVKNYTVTDKTGGVAAIKMVGEADDLLVITNDGTIIRTPVERISRLSRATQGVRVMRLSEGSRVIDIEKTEPETEEAETDEPEAESEE